MINTIAGGNNFANISAFVASNGRVLQQSLMSIAAGQKVMNPSNGVADYFVGNSYNYQAKWYETAKNGLYQAKIILDLASESMSLIFDDLNDIMHLTKEYFKPTTDSINKKIIENKITEIKDLISQTIDNTVFNGKKLLNDSSSQPLIEVNINPNNVNDKFVVSFDAGLEVNVGGIDLTLGESAAIAEIQTQIDCAAKYMGALNAFIYGINSQINLNEISGNTLSEAAKNVLGLDDLDGIITTTKRQIQQQAAISMLAQGNMMRSSVLNLIKF
ncbi:MAG: hypothetical protein LBH98_05815 [Chitinispirillales bacterium]|nr:hypothetical protein [Chitinispirillales bacterium]